MKREERIFLIILLIITVTFLFLSTISIYLLNSGSIYFLKSILIVFAFLLFTIAIIIIWNILTIFKIIRKGKISKIETTMISFILKVIYPLLIAVSKLFKIDVNVVRRVFTEINNFLITTKNIKVGRNKLLILLPHCLQNSECEYKITTDISNCRLCGKCDIKEILELCKKYNIKAVVATGGTLAREWIMKVKPKAIIAVACERDLCSGINDVKVLPVYGILNERPNGPCFNTKVDIKKIEYAIKLFLKED